MKSIKFEKNYPKLQGLKKVKLLAIFKSSLWSLGTTFLCYDTLQSDGQYYQFKGLQDTDSVLVLVFGDPETYKTFLTVRRMTPQKYDYYNNSIGEWFGIVVGKCKT
jgi:hypothetical protein